MKKYLAKTLCDGNELIENGALVVDGGKVVWCGAAENCPEYPVEGEEAAEFLMPGLIDCHVHLASLHRPCETPIEWAEATCEAITRLKELRSAGVVAARDLGSTGGLTIAISRQQKQGKYADLPLLISAGKALTATGGHGYELGLECDGPDSFLRGARQVIKEGADVVKVMMSGGVNSPGPEHGPAEVEQEEINAAVRAAHDRGRKVAVHAHGNTAIRRSVIAGVDSIEHGVFNSEDIIDMMLQRGTSLVPTLSAPYYATVEGLRQDPDNPDHKKSQAVVSRHNAITLKAFQMGVPVSMGTDAGCPFNPFDNACFELVLLRNIGIDAVDVLRIGTRNGAKLMELNHLGVLEAGREASFITLDKSPVEDMNNICGPKKVYIKGERTV